MWMLIFSENPFLKFTVKQTCWDATLWLSDLKVADTDLCSQWAVFHYLESDGVLFLHQGLFLMARHASPSSDVASLCRPVGRDTLVKPGVKPTAMKCLHALYHHQPTSYLYLKMTLIPWHSFILYQFICLTRVCVSFCPSSHC